MNTRNKSVGVLISTGSEECYWMHSALLKNPSKTKIGLWELTEALKSHFLSRRHQQKLFTVRENRLFLGFFCSVKNLGQVAVLNKLKKKTLTHHNPTLFVACCHCCMMRWGEMSCPCSPLVTLQSYPTSIFVNLTRDKTRSASSIGAASSPANGIFFSPRELEIIRACMSSCNRSCVSNPVSPSLCVCCIVPGG